MKIRVGMEGGRRAVLARARELNAPILVSANSLWNNKKSEFSSGWKAYAGFDVALDSGGFVAMVRYGGYRYSVKQYVGLAKALHPTWWAAMDFCCEPQIAPAPEKVRQRILRTCENLSACQNEGQRQNIPMPMPVVQGWKPADYQFCAEKMEPLFPDRTWPNLVGVGSVCRRAITGKDGIMRIVEKLDTILPPHVKLHLFGIKSQALVKLVDDYPNRIESTDSMAWNMAARFASWKAKVPNTGQIKADCMGTWYCQQVRNLSRPQLSFSF